jgi:hypothetical protein
MTLGEILDAYLALSHEQKLQVQALLFKLKRRRST